MYLDEIGHLSVLIKVHKDNNVHEMNLNYTHHISRVTVDRLQELKDCAIRLKASRVAVDTLQELKDCAIRLKASRVAVDTLQELKDRAIRLKNNVVKNLIEKVSTSTKW